MKIWIETNFTKSSKSFEKNFLFFTQSGDQTPKKSSQTCKNSETRPFSSKKKKHTRDILTNFSYKKKKVKK